MEQMVLLLTAIIFFFIGRYSMGASEIENSLKKIKRKFSKKGMVIDYPTAEEIRYEESGEKKVDEAREKVFKEQFKV